MKIIRFRNLRGPNIFTHKPVMVMEIDLGELTDVESNQIPNFVEDLLRELPELRKHGCSKGYDGGFAERLYTGTCFGHIIEHVALALGERSGLPIGFGKTIYGGSPGVYHVAIGYQSEVGAKYLLEIALELVQSILFEMDYSLAEKIKKAKTLIADDELGPSTKAIVDAAAKLDIPWRRIHSSFIQFGYGKFRRLIEATQTWNTKCIGVDISRDKDLTKKILHEACIRVPYGIVVENQDQALVAAQDIGMPVVVKPLDGRQGQGVFLNNQTSEEVLRAFNLAKEYSSHVLIEETFYGKNFRLTVVHGKLAAASERFPARVIGDGQHSIAQLIDRINRNPQRGDGHEKPLTKIILDEGAFTSLNAQGLTLDHVPEKNAIVHIRDGANLSTGGTANDVTDFVHPTIARMCERASEMIGLDVCGIDLITEDIAKPLGPAHGIIEVNAAPGIRMHHYPADGESRNVAGAIIRSLYPENHNGRIPIVSITGTNGKTTTARLVFNILEEATGKRVALTSTDGIFIGQDRIAARDSAGPSSARAVLSDPSVEMAVLETARGGIVREGLAYDWADVAVLMNIQTDHIGQDGIETVEDLMHIKSLVAERVLPGGMLVINADDANLLKMLESKLIKRVPKHYAFFGMNFNETLNEKAKQGHTIYYLKQGWIVERMYEGLERLILPVKNLPFTLNGHAQFQIYNLLAAIAVARSFEISVRAIASTISRFDSIKQNPGRTNLYPFRHGQILVDYGHNAAAFKALAVCASQLGKRVTAVLGVPGDRATSIIEEAGETSANFFQKVILKEDQDLRGRKPGEVAEILHNAIRKTNPKVKCDVILNENQAIDRALDEMTSEETVIIFYEKYTNVIEHLKARGVFSQEQNGTNFAQEISIMN